jgi:N-acetylmuramoyl-L-alanine amidase
MPKTIFVGAGHGGSDPGAVGNGQREADLALRLRDKIAALLLTRGFSVKTDGPIGVNQPLSNSIAIAKNCSGPRVEIHFNAGPPTAQGVEALSLPLEKSLAQDLAQTIAFLTKSPVRGEGGWKSDSSGQHHRLGFCREGGGVVVEVAFISNNNEMKRYLDREGDIAQAIAQVLAGRAQ